MDAPVVGAHPQSSLFQRAGRNRNNTGVVFCSGDVRGQATALPERLPFWIVGCQVTADDGPGGAAVSGFVNELAAVINGRRIERVLFDGGIPVESQFLSGLRRRRPDHPLLTRVNVPGGQHSAL